MKSISHKQKIDSTIQLYDLIKYLKSEIKLLKIYFENEKNIIIDTNNFLIFNSFIKIKKILSDSESDISGIIYINDDLTWFKENEEKILKSFREKFHDVLKSMVIIEFFKNI